MIQEGSQKGGELPSYQRWQVGKDHKGVSGKVYKMQK